MQTFSDSLFTLNLIWSWLDVLQDVVPFHITLKLVILCANWTNPFKAPIPMCTLNYLGTCQDSYSCLENPYPCYHLSECADVFAVSISLILLQV